MLWLWRAMAINGGEMKMAAGWLMWLSALLWQLAGGGGGAQPSAARNVGGLSSVYPGGISAFGWRQPAAGVAQLACGYLAPASACGVTSMLAAAALAAAISSALRGSLRVSALQLSAGQRLAIWRHQRRSAWRQLSPARLAAASKRNGR